MNAKLGHNPSYVWRSIWSSQVLLAKGIRWKIGDGQNIKVWKDPWLRDPTNMKIESLPSPELSEMLVQDLIVPGQKAWDIDLLHALFTERGISHITNIPLGISNYEDRLIWHFSENGSYTVKSGYHLACTNGLNEESQIQGDWKKIWKLKLPPKVKNFLWRLGRNCLPLKDNLQRRGISVSAVCEFCNAGIENNWHLFVACPFAQDCWRHSQLNGVIESCIYNAESFSELFFGLLAKMDEYMGAKYCIILWGIWRQRNDKVWNNKNKDVPTMIRIVREYLCDWLGAKQVTQEIENHSTTDRVCNIWHKPARYVVKCNVDAAFFPGEQKIGLGCVLRNDEGIFLGCRTSVVTGVASVKEGEAIGLLEAIQWVQSLGLKKVCFELDAKGVVKEINSYSIGVSEFGSIVRKCKELIGSEHDFSTTFVRRQANECAHALAKASRSYASPTVWSEPPSNITSLLEDVCTNPTHY